MDTKKWSWLLYVCVCVCVCECACRLDSLRSQHYSVLYYNATYKYKLFFVHRMFFFVKLFCYYIYLSEIWDYSNLKDDVGAKGIQKANTEKQRPEDSPSSVAKTSKKKEYTIELLATFKETDAFNFVSLFVCVLHFSSVYLNTLILKETIVYKFSLYAVLLYLWSERRKYTENSAHILISFSFWRLKKKNC